MDDGLADNLDPRHDESPGDVLNGQLGENQLRGGGADVNADAEDLVAHRPTPPGPRMTAHPELITSYPPESR